MAKEQQFSGTRKKAIARASMSTGSGKVRVNNMDASNVQPYLAREKLLEPIRLAGESAKTVDLEVTMRGGGVISQAEAARVSIAKALVAHDKKLEKVFMQYDRNMLVPDSRQKEVRKPNTHGRARAKKPKGKR